MADDIALADVIANFIMYYVFMADVIAKGLCVHPLFIVRQMLLPDVCGRC